MPLIQGQVTNPATANSGDGLSPPAVAIGRQGELLASEIHGKWYSSSVRNAGFTANRTAATVPAVAATLVSVFSLVNPIGSGVNLELTDTDIGSVVAATVVNTYGWDPRIGAAMSAGTFNTSGVAGTNWFSNLLGSNIQGKGAYYSAYTHSGTPARWKIVGSTWAVTSTNVGTMHMDWDGKAVMGPGTVISMAASTAAGTAAGLDLGVSWQEVPVLV